MIEQRPLCTLGTTRSSLVEATHHFSFAGYMSEKRDGWGEMRVLNHATIPPRGELKPQPIDGFDIVTVVRKGVLEIIGAGRAHRVTAGEVDVVSSSACAELGRHNPGGLPAEYIEIRFRAPVMEQARRMLRRAAAFPNRDNCGCWAPLATGFTEDGVAPSLRSSARVLGAKLITHGSINHKLPHHHNAYVVLLSGSVAVNGFVINAGDGVAIANETCITIETLTAGEIILVETI
ncbi:pirin family protein [Sphingomonas faeni]|uniref:pirin family protein n=1 Tax=Sphingomonas faeni TaxID=185950 RepID=UPI0027824B1F|nr:hypothetical protein [Sphingomonas faeni]MDQ0836538.1 redox-sensitive bicupin YhaK (pirin superfamily) [Sphingomonas faeni]